PARPGRRSGCLPSPRPSAHPGAGLQPPAAATASAVRAPCAAIPRAWGHWSVSGPESPQHRVARSSGIPLGFEQFLSLTGAGIFALQTLCVTLHAIFIAQRALDAHAQPEHCRTHARGFLEAFQKATRRQMIGLLV